MGGRSPIDQDHCVPRVSLDLARSATPLTPSHLHPIPPGPVPSGPGLGDEGSYLPCSPSAMFPIQDFHGATTGWATPPHHNRLVTPQSVYPRPTVPPRQSLHARPGPPASGSHGVVGHFRGLHPHPHPPQPSSLPGLLLQQPTLFLSGSPIRPQCGTLHFYQSPGLASPYSPHPGDQCPRLPRRHCPLAPLPHHSPPARCSRSRETLCHGVSGQPPEVSTGTPNVPPVAGHPLALTDRTLAGVPIHSGQDPVVYPPAPSTRPHHPPALGGSGGSHQLRVPGAQPLEGLPPASDCGSIPRFSPGPRRLSTHSPDPPPGLTVLDGSPHLGLRPSIPGDSSPPVPMDGRISLGMGCASSSSSHSSRPLGTSGGSRPHQRARASGSQPSHHDFQPVVLPPCRVYGQRDGSVRVDAPTYSLPPLTGGTESPLARHGQTTGVCSSPPHSHHPQCGGGRPEPARTAQHGVDVTSRGLPSDPSLGRSPSGRSPGLSDELPSSAVGLPLPSPGCSGLQLSKFRLERLRQHLRVSASRTDSDTATTHPRLQRTSCAGGSLGPTRSLVALSPPARSGPPASADDSIPTLRTRPGLPQVGDLRTLDRISFLRRALLASRPAAVVDTLLASYRPSSQRQQEVAWTAFRRWLPLDRSTVTKDDVLAFLQHLFSTRSLAPSTLLNYRAALQWPLEEAFSVDFSHPDFSRFATGLFHLRPPVTPDVPQWNLSAVIRFYEQVDHLTCSPRLLLFKTLCLTALASGNRCSELAHISRRAIVDQGSAITLPLLPRFLFKNQTASRCPPPISFPTFPTNPSVCPVETLRVFLRRTSAWDHRDFLFVNPVSHASLVASRINYWLVQAILAADVGNSVVRAHDMRKFAFSINWARRADMSHIIKHGFWSSVHPFLNNYLTPLEGPFPECIAAGSRV